MGTKNKKRGLFHRGALAAQALVGTQNIYFCPLCERGFGADSVENGSLTLEHVPPKALGGKAIILTCRECNSISGHTVDAELSKKKTSDRYFKALAGISNQVEWGTLSVGNTKLRAGVRNVGQGIEILIPEDRNSPQRLGEAIGKFDAIRETGNEIVVGLSPAQRFTDKLAKVSSLRAAFLACVALFGYSFAFARELEIVRRQIANPEHNVLPRWWSTAIGDTFDRIVAIDDEQGVVFTLWDGDIMFLPYPPRGITAFERHSKSLDQEPRMNRKFQFARWPTSFVAVWDFLP